MKYGYSFLVNTGTCEIIMTKKPQLNQIQETVDTWINQFEEGYWPPLSMLASVVEEVGELAREINSLEKIKKKKSSEKNADIGLELADILFSLVCLANYYEIDLNDSFGKVMEKYSIRDKDRWTKKRL